jgi:RNA polymerase sigma factor (TIGR02999 family)
MRRVLVDHARTRNRQKRGGGASAARSDALLLGIAAKATEDASVDLEALQAALEALAAVAPDAARMVDLRFFAGLSVEAAADVMALSPRSAARLWAFARAWLFDRLTATGAGSA